ncbi:hypothetical protein [Leeuwenhoekiella sp. W20_SRS_FM14]|uniref:hypothetical protein n=1 Tax=Leeuwenhoekiella sp. W20_SRS_FM14 TaxID=3240270 RepID=UPI003F95E510
MKATTQEILVNLFQIIDRNCTNNLRSAQSESIQKAILKKFFKASEVVIEHKEDITLIRLKSILSDSPDTEALIEIESSQLKSFLCDCIKKDTQGITFYTNMLHYLTTNKKA